MDDFTQNCVYGRNPVTELLKSDGAVDTVFLSEGLDTGSIGFFTALAKDKGAVVKMVRNEKLSTLADTQKHQGVVAFAAQIEYVQLQDLLDIARKKGEDPFLLLCDKVEDPHNLGALLRSALLCGVHGVVIPKRGGAGVTPVVMKSSAGAAAQMPIARVANIGETIRRLKKENIFVYCADLDGPPAHKQNLQGPIALVMGSEGSGVGQLIRKLCDGVVSLTMAPAGGVDSFNVSVAGGILLYEIARQRDRN